MHIIFVIAGFLLTILFSESGNAQESISSSCFPPSINDLQAVQFSQELQDANHKYRNTEISGYNAPEFKTAVTVYIYDKEPVTELLQEFRTSGSQVLAMHSGTESPMNGPYKLSIAGKPVDGLLGIFLWSEGETDFGSFLWIGELSGKYVKLRTTYIRPEQDEQTEPAMQYAMTAMRSVADHVCQPNKPKF